MFADMSDIFLAGLTIYVSLTIQLIVLALGWLCFEGEIFPPVLVSTEKSVVKNLQAHVTSHQLLKDQSQSYRKF